MKNELPLSAWLAKNFHRPLVDPCNWLYGERTYSMGATEGEHGSNHSTDSTPATNNPNLF
jgi:hypothetical protein